MPKKKRKTARKRSQKKQPQLVYIGRQDPIGLDETFSFQCQRCGDCCHNVKSAVPMESIDFFKLARHLKSIGHPSGGDIARILMESTETHALTTSGYPAFFLKSEPPRDKCVFLDGVDCMIQGGKPRACRIYPLSAQPNEKLTGLETVIVSRKMHHFTGPAIKAGAWLDSCFDDDDRAFALFEPTAAIGIERRLRKIRGNEVLFKRALAAILQIQYFRFNVDKPFMPQYRRNIEELFDHLDGIIRNVPT